MDLKFNDRLKLSAIHAQKLNVGLAIKSLFGSTDIISPSTYRGGGMWFWGADGSEHLFNYSSLNDCVKAYEDCPPLSAIIGRKASAFGNGRIWLLDKDNKEILTGKKSDNLRRLMKRPNSLQSWAEFEQIGYIYKELFGYNVILKVKPVGFKAHEDISFLWNLCPTYLDIQEKPGVNLLDKNAEFIESISFTYGNVKIPIPLEDLIIIRGNTPSFKTMFLPETKVKALADPINNIVGAYESRNVLINRRGPRNIFSSDKKEAGDNFSLSPNEEIALKEQLTKYGLRKGQMPDVITSAPIKVSGIGFATKDLMLFEEIQDDIQRICDSYNYPYDLLSKTSGTTFNNKEKEGAYLYQNTIIPEAESYYLQLSYGLGLDEAGWRLDKDFSHIDVLQQDKEKSARARKILGEALLNEFKNDIITLNRMLELLGEDTRPDGDKYFSEIMASRPQINNNGTGEEESIQGG